eukprot:scaffold1.g5680.t1
MAKKDKAQAQQAAPAGQQAPAQAPAPQQDVRQHYYASDGLLQIHSIKQSDKVDRVAFHPVQPWLAIVQRDSCVLVWNYESGEVVYQTQLGGADDGALQEAALHARAAREAAAAGLPPPAPLSPSREASLASKNTASGAVRDVRFFDLDVAFWQVATCHSMRYNTYDASTIPAMGRQPALAHRRWLVMACENKVVLHDLASADSRDIPRACFDSKAPTCLAFLLLNLPSLVEYGAAAAAAGAGADANEGGGATGGAAPGPGPRGGVAAAARGPRAELAPVLAVGTSGGAIYLLDLQRATCYAKLSGHKSAVTSLQPLAAEAAGGPDLLVSTSADGTAAVWDPSRTPGRGPDREQPPARQWKAHDGGVAAAALFQLREAGRGLAPALRLATLGDDRKLAVWNVGGAWGAVGRVQPLAKGACHSVGWAPWAGAAMGAHPALVLATGDVPAILGFNPSTGEVVRYASLQGQVDPGTKKVPKVYSLAVHPTRPHLLAVATNTGAVLMAFNTLERPAVVALPAQVVTLEALMAGAAADKGGAGGKEGRPEGGRGAQGLTYVMAAGGRLWSTALRLESQRAEGAAERSVRLEASAPEAIAGLDHPGCPVLACSPSGRSISVVWPQLRAYCVYSLAPSGVWEAVDRGSGNCVAWAGGLPAYAVISVPNIPTVAPRTKKSLFGGPSRKAQLEAEEAAAEMAARAATAATSVAVHVVDETRGAQHIATHELRLGGQQPVLLHGGGLLGVVLNKRYAGDGGHGGAGEQDGGWAHQGRAMQLFSWRGGFAPVGPELPEPTWVAWEPECTTVALAYPRAVELCATRPSFHRFASLALADTTAGLWQSRQLFVAGLDSLHVVFADPAERFVQPVRLASFQGGVDSKATLAAPDTTPLPPEQMRPAGVLVLAGVRHSYLWLADGLGRPFLVSLRHPGLRLRCLAARGELSTARTIAERGLSPAFHDGVARFLAAMGGAGGGGGAPPGVKEALLLPGLSPATELALAVRVGAWDRAARCFQALALGVADRGLLLLADRGEGAASAAAGADIAGRLGGLSLSDTRGEEAVAAILEQHAQAAAGAGGLAAFGFEERGGGTPGSEPGQAQQANGVAGAAAGEGEGAADAEEGQAAREAADPVDWDGPLRRAAAASASDAGGEGEGKPPAGGAAGAAAAAAPPAAGPEERARVERVTRLGLRFAQEAAAAGEPDAARSALGVLVRFAHQLPAPLLAELVFRVGQCRMTESARNLAAAAAAGGPAAGALHDPASAALLAALVGGYHGGSVQATLEGAGLAPLAAVHAAVWGSGNGDGALADWARQLAAAQPGGGRVVIQPPVA